MAAGGGGGNQETNFLQKLPEEVLANIGLFLTKDDIASVRATERARAGGKGFSTYPALVYKIKSIITVSFDFVQVSKKNVNEFAIFTDEFGNIRTDDLQKKFQALEACNESYKNWFRSTSEAWRIMHEKLEPNIMPGFLDFINSFSLLLSFVTPTLYTLTKEEFCKNGLWPAAELGNELKLRKNREPYSLIRVKKVPLRSDEDIDIYLDIYELTDYFSNPTLGQDGPVANAKKVMGLTITHEIITEVFKIEERKF